MATPKRVWSNKKTVWEWKKWVWKVWDEIATYDWTWSKAEWQLTVYWNSWENLSWDDKLEVYDSSSATEIGTVEENQGGWAIHVESISNVPESLSLMTDAQGTFTFNYSPTDATAPDEDIAFERDETFVWMAEWEFNDGTCTVLIQTGNTAWDWFVEIHLGESVTTIPVSVSYPDTISINTTLTATQVEVWQLAQIYFIANDAFTIGDTSQWLSNTELVSESWEWYNYIYKGTVIASWERTFTITWNTTWDSDSIVITCTNPTPPSDYVNIIWIDGDGGYEWEEQIIYVDASGSITATSDDVMVAEVGSIYDTPWTWTDPDTGTEYNYTHSVNLATHDAGTCHIHIELSSDPNVYAEQEITVWPIWETKYEGTAGTVMWNNLDNCIEISHNVVDPDDGTISVESVRYTNYIIETDWDTAEDWGPAYFQWGNCTAFRWTIPNTNTQVDLSNLSQDDLDNIGNASYYSPDFVTNATSWAEPLEDIETTGLVGTWIPEPAPLEWWRLPASSEVDIINTFRNEAMQDQDWNDEYLGILHYMYLNIAGIVDPTCTLDPNENTHYWCQESQVEYDPDTGTTAIWWTATAFYYDDTLWEFTYWEYAPTNWFCLIWFQDVI